MTEEEVNKLYSRGVFLATSSNSLSLNTRHNNTHLTKLSKQLTSRESSDTLVMKMHQMMSPTKLSTWFPRKKKDTLKFTCNWPLRMWHKQPWVCFIVQTECCTVILTGFILIYWLTIILELFVKQKRDDLIMFLTSDVDSDKVAVLRGNQFEGFAHQQIQAGGSFRTQSGNTTCIFSSSSSYTQVWRW